MTRRKKAGLASAAVLAAVGVLAGGSRLLLSHLGGEDGSPLSGSEEALCPERHAKAAPLAAVSDPKEKEYPSLGEVKADFRRSYLDFSGRSGQTVLREALQTEPQKNTVYSPASLYLALAMLGECTAGDTQAEILNALGFDSSAYPEAFRKNVSDFLTGSYFKNEHGNLLISNSVWIKDGFHVKQEPIELLAKRHFAEAYRTPFGTRDASEQIGQWISDHTGGRLGGAFPAAEDPAVLLTLINAIHFKDGWTEPFHQGANHEELFYLADGETVLAEYLCTGREQTVQFGKGYTAVSLSTRSGCAMQFILPEEGRTPQTLTEDQAAFAEILAQEGEAETRLVELRIPKFQFSAKHELNPVLQDLGVVKAFGKADFSPLSDQPLFLSQAMQEAFLMIDENGCEAAAYTAVMKAGSAEPEEPPQPLVLHFDRPFLVTITTGGLPLFVGIIHNPVQK